MWIVIRIIALILALAPIWYMSRDEEITQKQKIILGTVSSIGIILFIVTIFMRFS
ncbi:hypothetical protein ACWEX2_13525 [Staphylococcus xylosus]|uniref:hypothetical protein n=1 Tax=Staphylococcus xylosus TaxID=1288 RepID=UPI0015F9A140|nr:hypothetical protein [Staphylococcus xylosus]